MARSKKHTCLHYTGYAEDGGGIHALVRNLQGAQRFGVILGGARGLQMASPAGPKVWRGPQVQGERISVRNAVRALVVAWRIRRWLHRGNGRIFHGHSRAGLLVGLWLYFLGERRIVVSVHCYGRQRWFYRWAARRLGTQLYWLSPAMRSYYAMPGTDWEQCVPGCVPRVTPVTRQPAPGQLRLGGAGGLVRFKRWEQIIEAIGQLPVAQRNCVSFVHIGSGETDYLRELETLAKTKQLDGRVRFRGAEPSAAGLLREIDALVVASRNEAFSIAMLEALAAGVPVLAAGSGGAADIIRPEINGALYRDGDPGALAHLISAWLIDPPRFDPVKICGSAIYCDEIAARWEQIYRRL